MVWRCGPPCVIANAAGTHLEPSSSNGRSTEHIHRYTNTHLEDLDIAEWILLGANNYRQRYGLCGRLCSVKNGQDFPHHREVPGFFPLSPRKPCRGWMLCSCAIDVCVHINGHEEDELTAKVHTNTHTRRDESTNPIPPIKNSSSRI